jgi:hypothetical protein
MLDFTSVDRRGRDLRYPPPVRRQARGRRFDAALAFVDAGAPRRVFPGRTAVGESLMAPTLGARYLVPRAEIGPHVEAYEQGPEENQAMLNVACPSCGERGKIPTNLVGLRIKCKKCGQAFNVVAPPGKAAAQAGASEPALAAAPAVAAAAAAPASAPARDGIAVEGLDESTWTLAPDQPSTLQAVAAPERPAESPPAPSGTFTVHHDGPVKEYKLLTSRDKIFEGKFDMTRLEEAINHLAKQGWVAKSMCLPHMKNFQGAMQEEVVVLMER